MKLKKKENKEKNWLKKLKKKEMKKFQRKNLIKLFRNYTYLNKNNLQIKLLTNNKFKQILN